MENNETRIRKQLRLVTKNGLYCRHSPSKVCEECLKQISGDVSGIFGDVSGIRGNVSLIRGNVSDITGDVSGIWGDVNGIRGDSVEITEILKSGNEEKNGRKQKF